MRSIVVISILLIGWTYSIAQNTFVFRAQLYHTKSGPLKKVRVIVNNQHPLLTDEAGIFQVSLPRGTTSIRVSLPLSNHHILYPAGGFVAIPRDLKDVPQIIVGMRKENLYLVQYLNLYKQKKSDAGTSVTRQELSKKMDTLLTMLTRLNFSENDIKTAEKLSNLKDETIDQLTADLNDFRNSTRDLLIIFQKMSPFAFDQGAAVDALLESVKLYNENYNKLDRMHISYQEKISDYWQNDSLTAAFKGLTDFAINKLHPEKIYPVQEVVLQIKQYYTGKKKNRNTRKSLEEQIKKHLSDLKNGVDELEKKTNRVLVQLNN